MKNLFSITFFGMVMIFSLNGLAQTTTTTSGNWNTGGNWTAGVPAGGSNATVNHSMTVNTNIASTSGDYTINASITDLAGGTAYNISVAGTGGNQGNIDFYASSTFEGTCIVNGNGTLTVRSGATLTVGTTTFANNCTVLIEAGATLIINGNLTNNNNSTGITINGALVVNGNFTGGNGSMVAGSGTMETSGTITNNGSSTVFGSNNDCTTGPCSGNNLCVSNTISAAQTICSGQTPSGLTGSAHGGYTYQWQSSTTSSTGGFANIGSATGQNYSPGALAVTTWYRRIASSGGCVATSVAVEITVNGAGVTPTISASGPVSFCTGCSVTLTSSSATNNTWSTGATTQSINVTTTGNYSVTVNSGGCNLTSAVTAVTASACANHSWTGSSDNSWSTASNWNKCTVPGTGSDVTIPDVVTDPVVTGAVNCRNLSIDAGAILTVNGGATLNIYGDMTNNGSYSDAGTTVFTGAALQSVNGTTNFNNLTINNASGVTLNNAVTASGVVTLTSGTLTSGGNLTVNLNSGSISGTGAGSISGNINVYKSVASDRYHYIASPLMSGNTLADWNDNIQIKSGSYSNFYYYDETNTSPIDVVGWTAVSSLATPLAPLKGYALFFEGPATIDQTGTYTHGAVPSNVTLTNTVSADVNVDGWNLVGNPYPSTLDWGAAGGWTKTGIGNAIYFWDPVNDRYASYVGGIGTNGGTRYIPSMQAFWVHVTAAGTGTFGVNNNARVTSTNPSLWRQAASNRNILKLTAASGGYSDETIIRFREDALTAFDEELDAYKLKNDVNTPSLYTVLDHKDYSVNSLSDTSEEISVPLHIKAGFAGQYTISAEEVAAFESAYEILLEDKALDITQDLRTLPSYTFQVSAGDTTGRFEIHFKKNNAAVLSNINNAETNVQIRSFERTVHVDFNNISASRGNIAVYNLYGQPFAEVDSADISSGSYSLNLPAEIGIYIVRVTVDGEVYTSKVYLR